MNWRNCAGILLVLLGLGSAAPLQAETAMDVGQRKSQAGDLDGALAAYRQAVADEPRSALAHSRLAGIMLLRQQYNDSIAAFKTAIGLDRTNSDAFVGLGIAYLHTGRYALARAALEEALQLKPSRKTQIDQVLAWLDSREGSAANGPHP